MVNFKIFIITLKNRQDRIKKINSFYRSYLNEINLFYGIDEKQLKENKQRITTHFCNNFCTIPIIGCASSHILLWRHIYINCSITDYVLILEDDTFIDLAYLDKIFNAVKYLFNENNKKMFLQLVGEGLRLQNIETVNYENTLLTFEDYKYHFFLGAYMVTPNVCRELYQYFYINKINYHIDFSLNSTLKELKIKSLILKNNYIGKQFGFSDSNMNSGSGKSKLFNLKNYEKLYYALNIPIFSCFSIIITFNVLFLIILFIVSIYTRNVFYFLMIGLFILEIIKIDYKKIY